MGKLPEFARPQPQTARDEAAPASGDNSNGVDPQHRWGRLDHREPYRSAATPCKRESSGHHGAVAQRLGPKLVRARRHEGEPECPRPVRGGLTRVAPIQRREGDERARYGPVAWIAHGARDDRGRAALGFQRCRE